MKKSEAIAILERHNKWRRGAEIPMEDPTELGIAIDVVLAELKGENSPECGTKEIDSSIEDENERIPYCTDCGSEDLNYIDQYANGKYWECKECEKRFIY
jgi:hypothetical protein